jgi:hypothetical protein
MNSTTKPLVKAATAFAAAVAMLTLYALPASATITATTATILSGSSITIGSQTFGVGTPSCNDGQDNDQDGNTDYPADSGCASANDANERLSGAQTYVNPSVSGNYNDATDTFSGVALAFPSTELCVASSQCLTVTISDLGGAGGTLDPAAGTGDFDIAVRVDLDAAVGFSGLPANCAITPIPKPSGLATITTSNYDDTTGTATYEATGVAVPTTSGCGFIYGPVINSFLGLSSTSTADLEFFVDFNPVL